MSTQILMRGIFLPFFSVCLCAASVFLCEILLLLHREAPRFTEFHRDFDGASSFLNFHENDPGQARSLPMKMFRATLILDDWRMVQHRFSFTSVVLEAFIRTQPDAFTIARHFAASVQRSAARSVTLVLCALRTPDIEMQYPAGSNRRSPCT